MTLALVVAMAQNRVIGRANTMPWHLPSELQFFKQITLGKPIIMGRKTHQSIGRVLPGRQNIVVSRNADLQLAPGCILVASLEDALRTARLAAGSTGEIMLIGGAELYRQGLPLADRIYLTRVEAEIEGDTFFPAIDPAIWDAGPAEHVPTGEKDDYATRFVTYRRKPR